MGVQIHSFAFTLPDGLHDFRYDCMATVQKAFVANEPHHHRLRRRPGACVAPLRPTRARHGDAGGEVGADGDFGENMSHAMDFDMEPSDYLAGLEAVAENGERT